MLTALLAAHARGAARERLLSEILESPLVSTDVCYEVKTETWRKESRPTPDPLVDYLLWVFSSVADGTLRAEDVDVAEAFALANSLAGTGAWARSETTSHVCALDSQAAQVYRLGSGQIRVEVTGGECFFYSSITSEIGLHGTTCPEIYDKSFLLAGLLYAPPGLLKDWHTLDDAGDSLTLVKRSARSTGSMRLLKITRERERTLLNAFLSVSDGGATAVFYDSPPWDTRGDVFFTRLITSQGGAALVQRFAVTGLRAATDRSTRVLPEPSPQTAYPDLLRVVREVGAPFLTEKGHAEIASDLFGEKVEEAPSQRLLLLGVGGSLVTVGLLLRALIWWQARDVR